MLKYYLHSIRFRIIVLAGLGVLGMAVIAGTSLQLDRSARVQRSISEKCGKIVSATLQSMLSLEKFIRQPSNDLVEHHDALFKRITSLLSEIAVISTDEEIRNLAEIINSAMVTVSETFLRITEETSATIRSTRGS
jgi:hypothetical protein